VILLHLYRMAMGHAQLTATLAIAVAVFAVFLRWERSGRAVMVVLTILGVLLLDATLYPSTEAMTLPGIFHPTIAGQNIRLIQVLVALGLLARLLGPGRPRRLDLTGGLWATFCACYLTAAIVGLVEHNSHQLVSQRAMLALDGGGFALLVAGVPMRDYLADRALPRFIGFAGLLATANFVMAEAGVRVFASLPKLPLNDFGDMGSDAATLFPAFGFLGLAMELTRQRRRTYVLLASAMLLLAPLASIQRAARLGIAVTIVVFLVAVLWPRRRRFHARGGDWIVVAAVAAAVVAGPIFVRSVAGEPTKSVAAAIPFSKYTTQALSTDYRQGSVHSRYNEWRAAEPLIRDRPVFGSGLGTTFQHYEIGTATFVDYDLTNNIALDLLLRVGAIGLALFVAAIGATLATAWRVWRRARSDTVALLGAMTFAVLAGYLAKGMVESVLNEYHLTPLLGLLVGLVGALAAAKDDPDADSAAAPATG
jgi:O-antigen ligase